MTYLELITAAYRKLGIAGEGETLSAQMKTDGKTALNMLLDEWENDTDLALTEQQTFDSVAGTASYSVGDGETWDGNKPLSIEAAFTTIEGVDYPLTIIPEREYMDIDVKDTSSIPEYLTYTPSHLTGTVKLYPVPSEAGTVTILNSRMFTPCTNLTVDVELPKGYISALIYNLAISMSPEFPDVQINQIVIAKAMETLDLIRSSNKKRPMPIKFIFSGRNGSIFNINTGY
jgi:hypothetical protein